MAKDLAKPSWEDNYLNKSLSGIEVRDKSGKLVNFITIKHDEVLDKNTPHRITVKVDENAEPILPPPITFEEIIQAKRRYQMALYGSGSSSTTSTSLSDRTARRVAAAARQAATAANSQQSKRKVTSISSRLTSSTRIKKKKERASRKVAAVWPKPAPLAQPATQVKIEPSSHTDKATTDAPSTSKQSTSKVKSSSNSPAVANGSVTSMSPSGGLVTSMKDFKKHMPNLPIDPKEVKMILKSAPPGACVVLADGTVVKKSRRGGARAGAGRKRSRPLPVNQQPRASGSGSREDCNTQRSGKHRASEASNDLSYSDVSLEGDHHDTSYDLSTNKATPKRELSTGSSK